MAIRNIRTVLNDLNQVAKNFTAIKEKNYSIHNGIVYQTKTFDDANYSFQKMTMNSYDDYNVLKDLNGSINGIELFNFFKKAKSIKELDLRDDHFILIAENGLDTFKSKPIKSYDEDHKQRFDDWITLYNGLPWMPICDPFNYDTIAKLCNNKLFVEVNITSTKSIRLTKRIVQGIKATNDCMVKMLYAKVESKTNPWCLGNIIVKTKLYTIENYIKFFII